MQQVIPDENIPIYLQKFTVSIEDDLNNIVGNEIYNTVGAIPSNVPFKRVWSLNLTGELSSHAEKYFIIYDFSGVDFEYKNQVSFENIITGIFFICGRIMDARKFISYSFSDEKFLLKLEIDTRKWDFRIKKPTTFSYELKLNDKSCVDCLKCYDPSDDSEYVCDSSFEPSEEVDPSEEKTKKVYILGCSGGYFEIEYIYQQYAKVLIAIDKDCGSTTLSPSAPNADFNSSTTFTVSAQRKTKNFILEYSSENGIVVKDA